jgi:Pyruvate/2-oxoacid:ferredoxin oxidoreductase delta subunit
MCEFCTEHAEGKKWYLEMKNYAEDMLHEKLPGDKQAVARAQTREEWIGRFAELFVGPAAGGQPRTIADLIMAVTSTPEQRPSASPADALAGRKAVHFGQVVPLEDAERIIDLAGSVTRIPCGCRYFTTGKTDKRYCLGLGKGLDGQALSVPDRASSLEVLTKEQAKRILREFDTEGLIHTVWTGITPYIFGLCNCDRDCLAYRTSFEDRGLPAFFRAEYVSRVEPELCTGCRECMRLCQFGSFFYSSALAKVYIDPSRCFGCGVCRSACPADAIDLMPRLDEPKAASVWA